MEVIIEIEKTDEVFLNTVIHETEPLAVYQSDSTGDASFCSVVFPLTPDSKRLFWIAWEKGNNIRIRDSTKSYSVSISDRNRADRILNSFLEAEHSCIPDASEAETWLKRNHRIAPPMPIEVAHTRTDIFSDVLEMVRNEGSIEVKSFFYEGKRNSIHNVLRNLVVPPEHFFRRAWRSAGTLKPYRFLTFLHFEVTAFAAFQKSKDQYTDTNVKHYAKEYKENNTSHVNDSFIYRKYPLVQ